MSNEIARLCRRANRVLDDAYGRSQRRAREENIEGWSQTALAIRAAQDYLLTAEERAIEAHRKGAAA